MLLRAKFSTIYGSEMQYQANIMNMKSVFVNTTYLFEQRRVKRNLRIICKQHIYTYYGCSMIYTIKKLIKKWTPYLPLNITVRYNII